MSDEEVASIRKVVKLTLIRIGIRCDLEGFKYLCKAIEFVILDETLAHKLCKNLYPKLAKEFNAKASSIERSMRHAIENTFDEKSFAELNKMFQCSIYTISDKPTVGELIQLVAQYYLLNLYKEN